VRFLVFGVVEYLDRQVDRKSRPVWRSFTFLGELTKTGSSSSGPIMSSGN